MASACVTDEGMKILLSSALAGGTVYSTWYIGLVDNSGWTGFALADTVNPASHAGWTEFTGYTTGGSGIRGTWVPTSGGSTPNWTLSNASTLNFVITASSATLKGVFLVSDSTFGANGKLMASSYFTGGTQAVTSGDTLKVTYTMTGTAGST